MRALKIHKNGFMKRGLEVFRAKKLPGRHETDVDKSAKFSECLNGGELWLKEFIVFSSRFYLCY